MARAYRKKPVVVEAVQWTGENHAEMCEFIDPEAFEIIPRIGLVIHTLEGDHHASPGDCIIKGVNGEFYPCKPDIFAKTYESSTLAQPNEPLTLEELRKMDGQPVWVKCLNSKKYISPPVGWRILEKSITGRIGVWDGENCLIERNYGTDWLAYTYHPAHIDREAWEPCAKCVGCGNCYYFLYDDDEYPCNKCLKESTDKNQYPKFEPIGFCKHCGRPLTDEAVEMVMERLEKLHEDNGCS